MKKNVEFGGFGWMKLPRMFIIMKTWIILLVVCSLNLNATVYAQQEKMNVSMKEVSLTKLFRHIRQISSYAFVYDSDAINRLSPVTISVKEATLEEILDICLNGTNLSYVVEDNIVIIRSQGLAQQQVKSIQISGVITDAKKQPLPGATVILKGTSVGAAADLNGRYTFSFPETEKPVLIFSFIGMKVKEIPYAGQKTLDVTLEEDTQELDDVVVTGIFNKAKETYTGAVRVVTEKELQQFRGRNLLTTLANIDPSFHIIENNDWGSDPNRLPEVQIRGAGSIPSIEQLRDESSAQLNTPLIIMDGFESTLQRMMDLNDSEIQSITILKDGSATALYGSRGANGVVVITTKEPVPGQLRFWYRANVNVNVPDLSSYHLLNAWEKLELERLSHFYENTNDGATTNIDLQKYYNKVLAEVLKGVDTYWMSKPLQTAVDNSHNIRLEGGDQSFRYSLSLQYNNVKGVMKKSSRNNFNGSINLSYRHQQLIFRNITSIGHNKAEESPYGSFSDYVKLNPYWRSHDDDGKLVKYFEPYEWAYWVQTGRYANPYPNPLYNATLNTFNTSDYTNITNNFSIEWKPVQELILRGSIGISAQMDYHDLFKPADHTDFSEYGSEDVFRKGSYDYSSGKIFNYDINLTANYSKLFAERHRVYAGANLRLAENNNKNYSFRVEGFPDESIDFLSMALQYPPSESPGGGEATSRAVDVVGSVNYAYQDRYMLDATYRLDGSSQYGSERRFAPFWSLGLAWNVHHENFMQDYVDFIDHLKLRASYGATGSNNLAAYQAQETYRYYTNDNYNGWIGAYQIALGNKNLEWQKTDKYNGGLELRLLNNMISFDANVYKEVTSNAILDLELPYSNGFTSFADNLGETEASGFDVRASVWLMRDTRRQIMWSVTGGIERKQDKIVKLSEAMKVRMEELERRASSSPNRILKEGDSKTAIYAVRSLGIDPSTGKELYLTKNGEVTYTWSYNNQIKVGDSQPKYRGNISTMFRYRELTMNLSFGYLWGGQKYNKTLIDKVENADKLMNVDERVFTDRWQKPGDKAFFRGLNETLPVYASSRFVQDEATFWCQNINVAYEATGRAWLKHLGMQAFTVSANTGELFYLSTIRRERGLSFPFARQFSMSLAVTF